MQVMLLLEASGESLMTMAPAMLLKVIIGFPLSMSMARLQLHKRTSCLCLFLEKQIGFLLNQGLRSR